MGFDSDFQKPITGTFTGAGQTVDLTSPNQTIEIIQLSGTWTGTLIIEGSNNNSTFYAVPAIQGSTNLPISTITSNDAYVAITNGYQYVRIRASAWTSGTATLNVYGSDAATLTRSISAISGGSDGTTIGNNFGISSAALRTAAQIGNPTGIADFNAGATGAQTLRTVANQGAPNTAINGWFQKITDGVDTAKVTANQNLSVSDGLRDGGTQGILTLTTANVSYEAKVGVSALANRKSLTITANDDMFWGYTSAVTTTTGQPLYKNQQMVFVIDPDSTFQIWLIASGNAKTARIAESP